MSNRKEIAGNAVVVLFGSVFLAYAGRYPLDTWESPGPAVFPLIAGAVLTALGLWQLIRALAKAMRRDHEEHHDRHHEGHHPKRGFKSLFGARGEGRALRLILLFILYIPAMQGIGFFTATFLFATLTGRLTEARGWARHVALAAGLTLACYLLFEVWLKLSFPRGILF
jgi:ABC-type nickel/cobalt efflux system permease component RcnA